MQSFACCSDDLQARSESCFLSFGLFLDGTFANDVAATDI